MTATTADTGETTAPATAASWLNTWDSPWLNPKFLIGLVMILFVGLMGLAGPLFWDTTQARVASSPLNLPPPWAPGYQVETTTGVESGTGAGDSAVTGGNPFAQQQESEAEATTSGSSSRFGTPTWDHPLGTESNGRDMLAVLLVGAPRSLQVGLVAAGIGMLVGIILGFTAGFLGGWLDAVIRTISDSVITIPALAVLIVISAYVSLNNLTYMAMLLAIFAWPGPTRLLRSQVLSMRERGYVKMARLSGASTISIMFKEMMPNLLPYIAASFTGNVSAAILAATGLEVLGLGPTRIPTLGMTIFYAIRAAAILRGMWWWWGVPIAALVVIFTGLFLMTIGLDEIANPRLRGARAQ